MQTITTTSDTFVKLLPTTKVEDSPVSEFVKAGTEILAKEAWFIEETGHYFISTAEPIGGETRWWIFAGHARKEGTADNNNPVEATPSTVPVEKRKEAKQNLIEFSIPGISDPVTHMQPIYFGSNFTWGEATRNGERIPPTRTVTDRIVKAARYMDEVREFLGNRPIHITSWYRDEATNRRVGGARDSRHMYGDAVDFWVEGMGLVDAFYKLKGWSKVPTGLAVGSGFIHIDLRPGQLARWSYRGGPRVSLW